MRFDPEEGIADLDQHLDRLKQSAEALRLRVRPPCRAQRAPGGDLRAQAAPATARLLLSPTGAMAIEVKSAGLGGEREAQQAVGHRDQRRGVAADTAS